MLLCIDSGNTNIVFAIFDDDDKMREQWRLSTNSNRTSNEFEVLLGQLMSSSNITVDDINACIIASVVPASLNTLKSFCRDFFSWAIAEENCQSLSLTAQSENSPGLVPRVC